MKLFHMENKKQEAVAAQNVTVEEIHTAFLTEVDRLLETASIKKDVVIKDPSLLDKAEKLRQLGFTDSLPVKEANKEEQAINNIKYENQNKEELVKAINFFKLNCPNYKFITQESVKDLCKKYNLVLGPSNKYIGDIPDKNVQDMLKFSIPNEYKAYTETYTSYTFGRIVEKTVDYQTKKKEQSIGSISPASDYTYSARPFSIVAPVKDFNTRNMKLEDSVLSAIPPPDPIVLQPVMYNSKMYYLIVTAWGEEASDQLVVNETLN